jgi:hypothetical protein
VTIVFFLSALRGKKQTTKDTKNFTKNTMSEYYFVCFLFHTLFRQPHGAIEPGG